MSDIDSEAAAVQQLSDMNDRRCSCSSYDFETLIRRFPTNAAREQDMACDFLPLHHICRYGCSNEFIHFLIKCWPPSVPIATTEFSALPLHSRCRWKPSLRVVQLVVNTWPNAIYWSNHYGRVPLHDACDNGCTDDVIKFLIQCWPGSVGWRASYDGTLPLHLACRNTSVLLVI